ncbi:hypothetical protein [Flavobacterium sp.]|uniref:hypothetical protein n=1 Tax=Flavobacterium sp. TaxID=239 RepID=UPI00262FF5FC|nr:hypothetical protein [Flavobacterium sp.]MDD2987306.1 hypothetical protein [Flavobacterium sp.]
MDNSKTFEKLKSILSHYELQLSILHDKADNYYLNTPTTENNKKSEFFGAVQIKKSYVAFHLMPIYYYPELLDSLSQELKNRMQGKSCFNFKEIDDKLFEELTELTKSAFEKYKTLNKV